MTIAPDTLAVIAEAAGLFCVIAMSVAVVIYACRPRNKPDFDRAAQAILHGEDRPWQ